MEEFNEAFGEINPFDKLGDRERKKGGGGVVQVCVR